MDRSTTTTLSRFVLGLTTLLRFVLGFWTTRLTGVTIDRLLSLGLEVMGATTRERLGFLTVAATTAARRRRSRSMDREGPTAGAAWK